MDWTLEDTYCKHFPEIFSNLKEAWKKRTYEPGTRYPNFEVFMLDGPIKIDVLSTLYLADITERVAEKDRI